MSRKFDFVVASILNGNKDKSLKKIKPNKHGKIKKIKKRKSALSNLDQGPTQYSEPTFRSANSQSEERSNN